MVSITRVGFVGLGNLGFPLAVAWACRGFEVFGYDIDPKKMNRTEHPINEVGWHGSSFKELMESFSITYTPSLEALVHNVHAIFVVVPTPHDPQYEGITPMPEERRNFNYNYLYNALQNILAACNQLPPGVPPPMVVVVSTVLPGTLTGLTDPVNDQPQRSSHGHRPALRVPSGMTLVYNPSFCAVGTVVPDAIDPEIVLLGVQNHPQTLADAPGVQPLIEAYGSFLYNEPFKEGGAESTARVRLMSWPSAELCKVAYNTFVSAKLSIVNVLADICHRTKSANIDDVSKALQMSHRRITGPAYMLGGMGDGGACHPRDNIAMSWLAEHAGIHYNIFEAIMMARQRQAQMFADMLLQNARQHSKPSICVLGYAYKPDCNLVVGSHALLVADLLRREYHKTGIACDLYDPLIDTHMSWDPRRYNSVLIGCRHQQFLDYYFAPKSTIIDPFRYLPKSDTYNVIHWGVGK